MMPDDTFKRVLGLPHVTMSGVAVINGGANPSVRAMAEAIVVGQQSEIQRMTALLANR